MALNRGKCTRISSRSRSQPRFAIGRGNVGRANVGGVPLSLLAAIATNDYDGFVLGDLFTFCVIIVY